MATRAVGASGARPAGGRFWALAAGDGEEDDDDDAGPAEPGSPTASDLICEALEAGYEEKDLASMVDAVVPREDPARVGVANEEVEEIVRRVAHRRTAATTLRPWRGPLPKVIHRATALIRMWSLLTPMDARERLVTGSIRWEMVTRAIFSRFGWRSCNRLGV